jgi:putative transposase
VLDRIVWSKGIPEMNTVDNRLEFISNALDAWAFQHDVKLVFNKPGTPVDNAFIESFNGRVRDECLNMSRFLSLNHARVVIDLWKENYNTNRPHNALGGLTHEKFLAQQIEYFQLQVVL